jgi:hypothetical protein
MKAKKYIGQRTNQSIFLFLLNKFWPQLNEKNGELMRDGLLILQCKYSSSLLALILSFARSTARNTCSLVNSMRPGGSHGGGFSASAGAEMCCANLACANNHIDPNL